MNPKLKAKRAPEQRVDYISFADRLIPDETIDSSTVIEVGSSDLVLTMLQPDGASVRYLVSGGTPGQEYVVQAEAVTSETQILQKRKTFRVI